MRHPARWAALAVGAAVAVLAVVLATQVSTSPTADLQKSKLLGKQIPAFTVQTFDGRSLSPETLLGKAVIVNFWNSWCIPCQQELPALKQFQAAHASDPNVVLLGIVRDDTTEAARAYAKAEGMTWSLAQDPGSNVSLEFGTRGQPETYAISPSGQIVGSEIGPASEGNLEHLLNAAQAAQ